MGSHVRSLGISGSDQALVTTQAIYRGVTLRETGGTNAATVRLFDNASAGSGTLLDTISVPAGASVNLLYPGGLWAANGIFVDVGGTGTVEGSVRIA